MSEGRRIDPTLSGSITHESRCLILDHVGDDTGGRRSDTNENAAPWEALCNQPAGCRLVAIVVERSELEEARRGDNKQQRDARDTASDAQQSGDVDGLGERDDLHQQREHEERHDDLHARVAAAAAAGSGTAVLAAVSHLVLKGRGRR